MGTLNALLEHEGIVVIERAGAILLDTANLLRALALIQERNIFLAGLEGFHLNGDQLTPVMDMIVDTSGAATVAEAVDCIKRVVSAEGCNDMLYELISL